MNSINYYIMKIFEITPLLEIFVSSIGFLFFFSVLIITNLFFMFPRPFFLKMYFMLLEQMSLTLFLSLSTTSLVFQPRALESKD